MNVSAVAAAPAPQEFRSDRLIASRLHTLVVLSAMAVWSYGGMLSAVRLSTEPHPSRIRLFLMAMGGEWLMFALIWGGLLRARVPLSCVIGERWRSHRARVRDIGFAAIFWLVTLPALYLLRLLLNVTNLGAGTLALLPRSALEITLWIVLSMSAGFCEETIFRGYLQRQLIAIVGSKPAGMLLAAVAFGVMHLYQGWRMVIVIALYGLMFGIFAYWRRTVRPGMIAHAWQDAVTGILGSFLLRLHGGGMRIT